MFSVKLRTMLVKPWYSISTRARFILITATTAISVVILGTIIQTSFAPQNVIRYVNTTIAEVLQTAQFAQSLPSSSEVIPSTQAPSQDNGVDFSLSLPESSQTQTTTNVIPTSPAGTEFNTKFGHLRYEQADQSDLESVGLFEREYYEREEYLDYEATAAFFAMMAAAKDDGVDLMPVSGFRTIADQAKLFERQIYRQGSEEAAARLSAPPGYSEHHTGYAIDIADKNYPETDIKYSFENTPAYEWLLHNAQLYGFEQSFPHNNVQGVSFEPWHWRFVQSGRAQQVFYAATAYTHHE